MMSNVVRMMLVQKKDENAGRCQEINTNDDAKIMCETKMLVPR